VLHTFRAAAGALSAPGAFQPGHPLLLWSIIVSTADKQRAAGANDAPATGRLQPALLRLPTARRGEGRAHEFHPKLALVGDRCGLARTGGKAGVVEPQPDLSVVLYYAGGIFMALISFTVFSNI